MVELGAGSGVSLKRDVVSDRETCCVWGAIRCASGSAASNSDVVNGSAVGETTGAVVPGVSRFAGSVTPCSVLVGAVASKAVLDSPGVT